MKQDQREPYTFPCMDDSPTNNGYSERDWEGLRLHRRYPEDDLEEEENNELDFTVVNGGSMECINLESE